MKKVALINDLSGFGRCSLVAALPVISVLGISAHPLTTAVLTGQTGYKNYYCKDMTEMIPEYIAAWKKNAVSFDGIYSGFLTGSKQIKYVNEFLDEFQKKDTFLLVDPVMGDDGKVYSIFTEKLLENMKLLVKRAKLITPNLTEACMLTGDNFFEISTAQDKKELLEKVEKVALGLKEMSENDLEIIITGIRYTEQDKDFIYNFALTNKGVATTCSLSAGKSFSGTGDLFASAVCGLKMQGKATIEAMNIATGFVDECIFDTIHEDVPGVEGINFQNKLHLLMR